jgi:hypothetical protein
MERVGLMLDAADRPNQFVARGFGEDVDRDAPTSSTIQYHIHVNCFGDIPPISLSGRPAGRRLNVSQCRFFGDDGQSNLWILTAKSARAHDADTLYESIGDLLRNDPTMRGYIECEAVNIDDVRRYPESEYREGYPFPQLGVSLAPGRRVADIHVFRKLGTSYDELDTALESSGFYRVTSDRERIWTLLAGEMRCARKVFETLHTLFSVTGGVSKLELEAVRELVPVPNDFPLGQVCHRAF